MFFNDFLVEISKEMHDNGLKAIYDTDNLFGKGKSGVVVPAILASLSSGETIELTPAFETDGNYSFNIYTMIGKPLLGYSQDNHNKSRTTERALPGTTCIPDLCDMIGDILPELSNDATDCTCSIAEANIRMFANAFAAQWNKARLIGGLRSVTILRHWDWSGLTEEYACKIHTVFCAMFLATVFLTDN